MVRIVERVAGRYDVQEVELGRVYRWCPKRVVLECDCGERLPLTGSMTTRGGCGADHAAVVREELAAQWPERGEDAHPWRSWRSSGDTGIPF